MNEKLVLIVSEHRQFGWKFSLHLAEIQVGEGFALRGVPNAADEMKKGTGEAELALIRAMEEISDEALMKAYTKEKDKTKIPSNTIDNLIRPRIERQCTKILQLAQQAHTPVYYRQDIKSKVFSEFNHLEILPEFSHCLFNFIKDENGLRYFISLTYQEQEIVLQQEPAIVLSDNPCIVLLKNKIHQVKNIESKKLVPFFTKTHVNVPASTEKIYIQKFIIKTIPKYEVRIEGIEMREKFPQKQAILTLDEDFFQCLRFSLLFQYDNQRLNPALQKKKKIVGVEEINGIEHIYWFERDSEWESRLFNILIENGLQSDKNNRFYFESEFGCVQKYGLIEWMNRHAEVLEEFRIEQSMDHPFYQGKTNIESYLSEQIDWFDLRVEVVFDCFRIPFGHFRRHILNGNPEYVLPDGRIFILPEEWFQRYHDVLLHSKDTEKGVRLKKMYVGLLNNISDFFLKDRQKEIEAFQTPAVYPVASEKLDRTLRTYQKQGFYWLSHLHKLHFGGCLADDMGLGKTLQTIALLDTIYSNAKQSALQTSGHFIPASLVVVPTSLLHNWKNELQKFAPDLKAYIHAGNKRLRTIDIDKIFNWYQVIITSYSTVRNDIEYLSLYSFYYVILDESQYIKNPDSILYGAVKSLNASHRLVITGTPIENSLTDLWAQFNFINPGLLGNLSSFKENYINKIIKENNKMTEESLLHLIQPFFLRRTKEEVAVDLPPLSQEIVFCDMTEAQEEVYNKEKNSIRNHLLEDKEQFISNKFYALQSLMRLRLLSNHPVLTDAEYTGDSGKLDQILLYFESIRASGHKVLIFSSFVKHLRLLAQSFDKEGQKYALLTGQTPQQSREDEINRFNRNEDVHCFLISLKAGGTGLNLTAADYVFIIDPWWNPAVEMQALSRSHRIGQNKNVMVYRFISSNSVEEKILHLQTFKSRLSGTFITSNNPLEDLGDKEIEELFAD
ncbi:MAG: DEAD/DEAH box helicase [Candidatus Azobacteroides sp.]|nr:DEAD/DEAH box helicase [Candidatus Azobacteroides sp.]